MRSYWVKMTWLKVSVCTCTQSKVHSAFWVSPTWGVPMSAPLMVRAVCPARRTWTNCISQLWVRSSAQSCRNKHKAAVACQICLVHTHNSNEVSCDVWQSPLLSVFWLQRLLWRWMCWKALWSDYLLVKCFPYNWVSTLTSALRIFDAAFHVWEFFSDVKWD